MSPRDDRRSRWIDGLRRVRELSPLTVTGWCVLAGSYLALQRYGYGEIDLVLLVIGGLGVLLSAGSALLTVVAAILVWLETSRAQPGAPVTLESGWPAETGFSLPALWWLPFVSLRWRWHRPEAEVRLVRRGGRLFETVLAERRAAVGAVERRVDVGDAFGIARVTLRAREERPARILPAVGALRQMHVIRGLTGGSDIYHQEGKAEGDPFDTRRYAPGDPIRFVLWKVFAKSRQLIVRTPERAVSAAQQTVAYLVASDGDEPAAGAARAAVESGAFGGDWTLGADGGGEAAGDRDAALRVLSESAGASEAQSGAGLAPFVSKRGAGRVVVFVPPRPGPWLRRVAAAVRELGVGRVDVVVSVDGVRAEPTGLARWLARGEGGGGAASRRELAEVVRVLAAAGGARVTVLDRTTGRVLSARHVALTEPVAAAAEPTPAGGA